MPKLLSNITNEEQIFQIPGTAFTFSGVRPDKLGATEYTLVSIVIDISGSVDSFSGDLLKMLKEVVEACQKHPRKENLMVRVVTFNSSLYELHPFKPVMDIVLNGYKNFNCGGCTALFDATIYSVGATKTYAENLSAHDLEQNAAIFIITDGEDNNSTYSANQVKKEISDIISHECLQSILTVLIGVNSQSCGSYLKDFQMKAGISQYIDIPDVTPSKLAKLAQFISQSVSSTSQSLATKTPSVPINITF